MFTYRNRKLLPAAVLLASGLAASNVMAQLEEVIVTAQKREQSLQDTPISVTAFDTAAIDAQGIANIKDLASFVPNLQIVESPGGTSGATISIRGAVTINPAVTWEPTVGMYLDGVFLGKNLGGIFEIAELERVEVLRGPQGTLYGKNTVGGAINLITRLPASQAASGYRRHGRLPGVSGLRQSRARRILRQC
jgi:iron complex outermembrane receptor protein